jgi:hypothetical protein
MTRIGGGVSIVVNNRGPAIPAERISGIFDPMVRIAATVACAAQDR